MSTKEVLQTVTGRSIESPEHGWEVDDPDGLVVYLGRDLHLAEEIYYCLPDGAHLRGCEQLPPAPRPAAS